MDFGAVKSHLPFVSVNLRLAAAWCGFMCTRHFGCKRENEIDLPNPSPNWIDANPRPSTVYAIAN